MADRDYLLQIVDFIKETEKLKDVHRSGYTSGGKSESTAEHSWRLGLLAMLLMDKFDGCDPVKILSLCLIHDLGELDSGDIPAVYEVAEAVKFAEESATIKRLSAILPMDKGHHLLDLWQEYERGETPEAKMVKALDKMETIMQHNQGSNPKDFDYKFNLDYGKHLTRDDNVLQELRTIVDDMTKERLNESEDGPKNEKAYE